MTREETIASLKYFSPARDPKIDWDKVGLIAIVALDNARADAGVPMSVTSNYRTPDNPAGFPTDEHREIPTMCFDITLRRSDGKWDSQKAFKVIPALVKNGFNRIGLNFKNNSLHAGMSPNFPQNVLFIE